MPFPKQRFVVDWKRRVWRRWFHSYHFNFPSFSPSLPVPLLPLLLLLLLPHHSSTRFAFRGGCGATSHTIAHRGSKKLVWAWKPFPIFTNFLFSKENFFHVWNNNGAWLVGEKGVVCDSIPSPPISLFNLLSTTDSEEAHVHAAQHHNPLTPKNTKGQFALPLYRGSNLLQIWVENWVDQFCVGHLICGWQAGSPATARTGTAGKNLITIIPPGRVHPTYSGLEHNEVKPCKTRWKLKEQSNHHLSMSLAPSP